MQTVTARRLRKVLIFGALMALAWLLKMCVSPQVIEISRSTSPDGRRDAILTRTIYDSIFSSPTDKVVLRFTDFTLLADDEPVAEVFEDDGELLRVRWLDGQVLEITASKDTKRFYRKDTQLGDVVIWYTTAPAQH